VNSSGPLSLSLDVSAVPEKPVGAGHYTIELLRALIETNALEVGVVSRRNDAHRWRLLMGPNAERHVTARAPGLRPARLAWEQLRLPLILDALAPDVNHSPHYTMPERARIPSVVTIHDCTFFDHPEWHERSKVWVFRRAIAVAAQRASVIVCVSATTERRLRQVCDVRAPIVVAPHGVDHTRFFSGSEHGASDDASLSALGLQAARPFVLYVGTVEPRKGVAALIGAFDRVASRHLDLDLVIAGQFGWGTDDVEDALGRAAHRDRIIRTGYVPDDAVPALLRRATVVAYPAIEEGYGLPALEALACGAPLVTTSGTAMEEFAQGAALLVPPGDQDALADAIESIVSGSDPDLEARRTRGLAVAGRRTWQASAQSHLRAYRYAAGLETTLEPPADQNHFPPS
jgi:glycosyltransferase involved in cell wall biosynthesis